MELHQLNKELNYCYSCEYRKLKDSFYSICLLTGKTPSFKFSCYNYKYDNKINIKRLKEKFETRLKNSEVGIFNGNTITNLIDCTYGEKIQGVKINSNKILRYNSILKYLYIAILAITAIYLIITDAETPNEFNETFWISILLFIGVLFVIRKELLITNKIIINRFGLTCGKNVFLWKFIEGLYLQEIDNGGDSDEEEYLIILMKSGKEFKLDVSRINFFSKKSFKRLINSYRNIDVGIVSMHNNP